jgi:hypothetical protein
MVWAIIDAVQNRSAEREFRLHALMDFLNKTLRKVAARNTGLIGDHYDSKTSLIESTDCLSRPGKQLEPVDVIYIAYFLTDGSIPIEKHGAMHQNPLKINDFTRDASSAQSNLHGNRITAARVLTAECAGFLLF